MKILLVCLGNICRSPAGEAALRRLARDRGVDCRIESCAVGPWNIGKPAHPPMVAAAQEFGLNLSQHRARMISDADFTEVDVMVAMDQDIYFKLRAMRPEISRAIILPYQGSCEENIISVPDPYYTKDFAGAMKQIVEAANDLLDRLLERAD